MNISDSLLALVLQYTQFVVPVSMLLGGIGAPLPNSMVLIVLGTLIQQNLLNAYAISWLVVIPTVCGDVLSFLLAGRILRSQKWQQLTSFLRLKPNGSERAKAQRFFTKFGHWSILLSRFAVTPLAIPINILAASTEYPLCKFIIMDVLGEIIWAALYTTIGYYFGVYWQTIYQLLNNFIGLLSMTTLILVLLTVRNTRKSRARKNAQRSASLEATNTL